MVMDYERPSESLGIQDHETDLIRELGRRLGCMQGYDRNIARANRHHGLLEYWQEIRSQEERNIERLKELINNTSQATVFRRRGDQEVNEHD